MIILKGILSLPWGFLRFIYCCIFIVCFLPFWVVGLLCGKGERAEQKANAHLLWVWYDIKGVDSLENRITVFQRKFEELELAEKQLNAVVEVEMKKLTTVGELQELIDILPKKYKGIRKIYQMMDEL